MRVVITGASGIVGSHVLKAALRNGIDAIGTSRQTLPGLFRADGPNSVPVGDVLIHLAEPASRATTAEPQELWSALEKMANRPWRRIIYMSSVAVYGPASGRIDESTPARDPHGYVRMKLGSERIVIARGGTVLRLSNVLSGEPAAGTIAADILSQIPGEGSLRIRSSASLVDMLWVGDVVDAVLKAATTIGPGVFNLTSGTTYSVGALAQAALLGAGEERRPVVSGEASPAPAPHFQIDNSKLVAALDWRPSTDALDAIFDLARRKASSSV